MLHIFLCSLYCEGARFHAPIRPTGEECQFFACESDHEDHLKAVGTDHRFIDLLTAKHRRMVGKTGNNTMHKDIDLSSIDVGREMSVARYRYQIDSAHKGTFLWVAAQKQNDLLNYKLFISGALQINQKLFAAVSVLFKAYQTIANRYKTNWTNYLVPVVDNSAPQLKSKAEDFAITRQAILKTAECAATHQTEVLVNFARRLHQDFSSFITSLTCHSRGNENPLTDRDSTDSYSHKDVVAKVVPEPSSVEPVDQTQKYQENIAQAEEAFVLELYSHFTESKKRAIQALGGDPKIIARLEAAAKASVPSVDVSPAVEESQLFARR